MSGAKSGAESSDKCPACGNVVKLAFCTVCHPPPGPFSGLESMLMSQSTGRLQYIHTLESELERLRAVLVDIARFEPDARDIVANNRWPSTLAIDLAGKARMALEAK